ncbi:hypothetical protein ACFXTI_040231 [Malus domestica]
MGFRRCLFVSNMCYILSKLLLFHLVVVSSSVSSLQQSCHDEERSALLQFKESFIINRSASDLDDAYPKTSQWKLAEGRNGNCCAWDGIVCDGRTGHVIGLDLSSSCLLGSINSNSSLFQLVQLQALNLADNNFNYSRIPTSIRNFPRLVYLNLSMSVFSGQIPSQISQLAKLSSLDLSWNQLNGPIPFLGNLTHLTVLNLSFNQLIGPIPCLGNLTHLTKFSLSRNQLTGPIPSLGNLIHLTRLSLSRNLLTGPIPSLGNLTHLTLLYLYSNQLTGPIPNSLSDLVNLEALDLTDNNLTGTVEFHVMFHKLQGLVELYLARNRLKFFTETESMNASLLPKLKFLGLGSCNIREFPSFLQYRETLEFLDLSTNNLHGEVPKWMLNTSTKTMTYLEISHNFLSSIVQPSDAFPWVNLQVLGLKNNLLHGPLPIPPPHTVHYRVGNNNLNGTISPLICSLTSLQLLDLSNNNMSGMLPPVSETSALICEF